MTASHTIRPFVLAIISCCLLPAALRAAEAPPAIAAAVDGAMRPLMKDNDVPGLAVAVSVDGRHYFFNYGVAAKEPKTPVTENTLFEIGSVSKTFTAILVGYAQTQGKLSLDDRPGKFMPELRGSAIDKATVLELGSFTAGGLPLKMPDSVRTDAEMKTYFRQWKPKGAPGTLRQYSNPSLGLFGRVAALALKRDFADVMETEIFPKLGLRHSYIHVPATAMGDYAWGYNKDGKPVRVSPGVFDAEAYGVKTSAADLIRYVDANLRPETIDEPIRRALEGTHVGYFTSGELIQGLGWEQYPYPVSLDRLQAGNAGTMITDAHPATRLTPPRSGSGPTLFNKTGSTNGFGAYVMFVPAKGIGLVMLANKNVPIPARVAAGYAVLDALARVSGRLQ